MRTVKTDIGKVHSPRQMPHKLLTKGRLATTLRPVRAVVRWGATEADWLRSRRDRADLAIFHEFRPPPYGGGNQFLLALVRELESRGLAVEANLLSGGTPACLYNSFNFDFRRLRSFAREGVRMVHRVDGPIGVYRGFDDGTDRRIVHVNHELADATIVQSRFSLDKHRELGLELRDPVVIPNAVDPAIFRPPTSHQSVAGRRVRVIASSWSDNPRKGTDVLAWLDRNLDFGAFELTFVGRTQARFQRIEVVGPPPSEALACGLPAAFLFSGGHPELVGEAGIGFDAAEEVPGVVERLADELTQRRAAIRIAPLSEGADRYLEVMHG